jgi:microcin C transport system permease protein
MYIYILKRLLLMIPTLFGIMLITFVVTQFVPGGPVEQLVSQLTGGDQAVEAGAAASNIYRGADGIDQERLAEIKALYGFDKPPIERFWTMMKGYLSFDLGDSYFQHQSVMSLIASKLPVSISLGMWTFFITYLTCIPLGIAKAVRDGTRFDTISSTLILIGYAIPGFILGISLLVLFGGGSFWDIFPLRGIVSDNWDELDWLHKITDYLWHMTLPVIASVVGSFAVMTMLTKNSFIEEIRKQYVVTARAKGLEENRVLYKHIFRNALIPLVTGFPAAFIGSFFANSLLIETIFSLDGLGLLSYESILKRDYPVVLGSLYLFTIIGLVTKLITDLCYVWVDPRVKFD